MNYRNVLRGWLAILASAVGIVSGLFAIGVYYKSDPLSGLRQAWFDLVGLPGSPPPPQNTPAPTGSNPPTAPIVISTKSNPQYAPGWIVQLRTATAADQAIIPDSAFVAAYINPGPSFEQATFDKKANLEGSDQLVLGTASAKFDARTKGTYQLGLRMEIRHPWADIGCSEKLSIEGATVIERWGRRGTFAAAHDVLNLALAPVALSPGLHDVELDFGCVWYDKEGTVPRQAGFGKVTVFVGRPDAVAANPAEPTDFLYSASNATRALR